MRRNLSRLVLIFLLGTAAQSVGQTTYDGPTVEAPELRVELLPVGETQFAIHLTDKVTGLHKSYEFEGEGANDPEPFLLVQGRYCDTPVILLTIMFPWRHALPQYRRVLDTYAFRASDLGFIHMAVGSLTDIALVDNHQPEANDTEMQPPILVECISEPAERPFRFIMKTGD